MGGNGWNRGVEGWWSASVGVGPWGWAGLAVMRVGAGAGGCWARWPLAQVALARGLARCCDDVRATVACGAARA
jgi:hypothetical protein